jgi:hypothetical protein
MTFVLFKSYRSQGRPDDDDLHSCPEPRWSRREESLGCVNLRIWPLRFFSQSLLRARDPGMCAARSEIVSCAGFVWPICGQNSQHATYSGR